MSPAAARARSETDSTIATMRELFAAFLDDTKSMIVLLYLLLFDSMFVVLHLLNDVATHVEGYDGLAKTFRLGLNIEFGAPEFFNYMQIALLCYLLISIFRITDAKIYLAWGLAYVFVFLDDSLSLHEALGLALAGGFNRPDQPGFRPQDFGELVAFGLFGLAIGSILLHGYLRSATHHRRVGICIGMLFGLLVFFGVVVDSLHSLFSSGDRMLETVMIIAEDGGEMISISLSCAFAVFLRRKFRG